jgi:hypothetical protein
MMEYSPLVDAAIFLSLFFLIPLLIVLVNKIEGK